MESILTNLAQVQASTALAIGIMIGLAALGALFKNVGVVTALTVAVAAVTTVWDLARRWQQRGAPRAA